MILPLKSSKRDRVIIFITVGALLVEEDEEE